MATTYYLSNTDGDLTVGSSFNKYLSESTEPALEIIRIGDKLNVKQIK